MTNLNMTAGYIYVLRNDAFPHLLKIGKTTRSPEQRAAELTSSGVPLPFRVVFSWEVRDVHLAERHVHQSLSHFRVNNDREFFAISPEDAERLIRAVLGCSPKQTPESTGEECSPRETSASAGDGCLGAMTLLAVFWGLMHAYGDSNPSASSWAFRLWLLLYLFTTASAVVIIESLSVLLFGQQKETPVKSFVEGIAGLVALYFISRIIWSFY
jgi:hypothetical protein